MVKPYHVGVTKDKKSRIEAWRKIKPLIESKFKITELAGLIGVKPKAISNYFKDETAPSHDTLSKIYKLIDN